VVVGAKATPQELQSVRDFASRHRGAHVARPDWLRLCAHERRLVPLPDERCTLTIEATLLLIRGAAGSGPDAAAAGASTAAGAAAAAAAAPPPGGAAASTGVFSQSVSGRGGGGGGADGSRGGGAPQRGVAAPWDGDATVAEFWQQAVLPPESPERLFADCWFTLAALAGDKAAEDEARETVMCVGAAGGCEAALMSPC
jgi:hypothetical protein